MPYAATLAAAHDLMLTASIVLVREGVALAAQAMHVEFVAGQTGGRPQVPATGSDTPGDGGGSVSDARVFAKDDADLQTGDQFVHDGIQYRLGWVSPKGRNVAWAGTVGRVAYATATEV